MKLALIIILSGCIAIPILTIALYGDAWEVLPWVIGVAVLAIVVLLVNKFKGTRPF